MFEIAGSTESTTAYAAAQDIKPHIKNMFWKFDESGVLNVHLEQKYQGKSILSLQSAQSSLLNLRVNCPRLRSSANCKLEIAKHMRRVSMLASHDSSWHPDATLLVDN